MIIISFSLNSMDNEFVYDDIGLLKESQEKGEITKIKENITAYRPVRHLSYMLDYQIFRGAVSGYRIMNIFYHAVAAIFLFLVINLIFSNKTIALITALIFAIHPVQTESVIYISGRRDVLAGLFFFITFYLILACRKKRKPLPYMLLFTAAYILGIFSKENVAVLPGIILFYDIFINPSINSENSKNIFLKICRKFLQTVKKYSAQYIILLLITIPFVIFKLFIRLPALGDGIYGNNIPINLAISMKVFLMYIYKTLFPLKLAADYSYNAVPIPQAFSLESFFYLLIILCLLFILFKWLKKNSFKIFCFSLFFLPIFPVLHIIAPYHVIFADHQLYISTAGFGLLFSKLIYDHLFMKNKKLFFYLTVSGLLIFYSARTIVRNRDWKNSFTLWSSTVEANPDCARAHNNLGSVYLVSKDHKNAIYNFNRAIEIEPGLMGPYINIVTSYFEQNDKQRATEQIRAIHSINPDDAGTFFTLGLRALRYNALDIAVGEFKEVIRISPGYAPAYINLSLIYSREGKIDDAISLLELGIKSCKPSEYYHWLYYKLASNYLKQNKISLAMKHLQNTIKTAPGFHMAYLDMGNILLNKKQYLLAWHHYKKANDLKPNNVIVLNKIGYVSLVLKKFQESESFLSLSLSIKPTPEAFIYKALLYGVLKQKSGLINILQAAFNIYRPGMGREIIMKEIRVNTAFDFIRKDVDFIRITR